MRPRRRDGGFAAPRRRQCQKTRESSSSAAWMSFVAFDRHACGLVSTPVLQRIGSTWRRFMSAEAREHTRARSGGFQAGGKARHLRVVARHRLRVVRLLPLRDARAVLRGAVLSPRATRPRRCCRRSPPMPPASWCARSARWCSAASATWSAASTRSWSPSWSWAARPSRSACCRPTRRSAGRRRSCW